MITNGTKIVVPYDGSDLSKKALNVAKTFLKRDENVRLFVIMVVNMRAVVHHSGFSLTDISDLRAEHFREANAALREVEEQFQSFSKQVETLSLEGEPGKTIINYIEQNGIDLVIMGSRGLSGLQELFLGSVSHYVVQKSPCHVYIVK